MDMDMDMDMDMVYTRQSSNSTELGLCSGCSPMRPMLQP